MFVLASSASGGPRNGIAATLGIASGSVVHASAAALGISALIAASPVAFEVLRLGGALYLAWIGAQAILKATKVDGVYSADPKKHADATRFDQVDYLQVLQLGLEVMDSTALTLCMDNGLPIIVFDMNVPGNIRRVVMGETIGTYVGHAAALAGS